MIKILIIIDKWLFGGREKVIENVINNINRKKFKIDILVIKNLKEKGKLIEKDFPNMQMYFLSNIRTGQSFSFL